MEANPAYLLAEKLATANVEYRRAQLENWEETKSKFQLVPPTPFPTVHPLLSKTSWEHYSLIRAFFTSAFFGALTESATIHYCRFSHSNKIQYPGTVVGIIKETLHHEGLNSLRTAFPAFAIHSPLAKMLFFPIFEFLRLKSPTIPNLNPDIEEPIRTGLSAVGASLAVFWFSRAGELNNILASKFHTVEPAEHHPPFGTFSAMPKFGSPFYSRHNQLLMFMTKYLVPNIIWWPSYVYTKNWLSKESDMDPNYGANIVIMKSALTAAAVTTIAMQPIFTFRDILGDKNFRRLFTHPKETCRLYLDFQPYRFYVTKNILARFALGAPLALFGAFGYEMLRLSYVSPSYWKKFGY